MKKILVIAYYLPQFHPIEENDKWWGKGFTEWRNVAKARRLYRSHKQPNIPADLGFYDLRMNEIQIEQAKLAAKAGLYGFCYYHYWYSGRLLLEKPLEQIIKIGKPNFPYSLCWANHDWTMHWVGKSDDILVKQEYGGSKDDFEHYNYLRKFFIDNRYIKIKNRPMFSIFSPEKIPNLREKLSMFNSYANDDGFDGIYFIANSSNKTLLNDGFSALAPHTLNDGFYKYLSFRKKIFHRLRHILLKYPRWVIDYETFTEYTEKLEFDGIKILPTIIPNWDNTPRIGRRGIVLHNSTPTKFKKHLQRCINKLDFKSETVPIIFIKSWNEWAEGNYLEPDIEYGLGYLDAIEQVCSNL